MGNYNFSTLNDKDFEILVKDLLNAKFNLELQNFKPGKDKGVDLRYSTQTNNNSIVVQAKHFRGSGYSKLKNTLKNEELKKVKDIMPDRYLVATSVPLSNMQKDEIKDLMKPYIKTSNDVIGQEDLNSYLDEFPEIEKRNFKLWFSSVAVLESIINNAVEGRTRFLLEDIGRKMPFYVITRKLDHANWILDREKLLLITGQPGIGKTTLADVILFERAKNDYKIHKVENIREAEDVISPNNEEKQLFYFDDFLGANYVEILNRNTTETQLTSFVERIRRTPNKYLVLTTRTIILNHAVERFEKIGRSSLAVERFEIELSDYTKYEKALILYNHLFFKEIKEELYTSILNEKFYKNIIEHKNYTPRIIEFITDKSKIDDFSPDDYHQYIQNNLNNPKESWRHSFEHQIGYFDRCLLLTLFTFNFDVPEKALSRAFEKRLQYEKREHNQIIKSNQFNDSIRILLNGFVSSVMNNDDLMERHYSFINPSLADFLINYISESESERKSIVSGIVDSVQLNRFDPAQSVIPLEENLQIIIRDKLANYEIGFPVHYDDSQTYVRTLRLLCEYCQRVDIDAILLENFKKINFENSWGIGDELLYVLLNVGNSPQTINFIKADFIELIEIIFEAIYDESDANEIVGLFKKYDHDFERYQKTDRGLSNLVELIERIAASLEEDLEYEQKTSVESLEDVGAAYCDIKDAEDRLCVMLLLDPNDYSSSIEMDEYNWEEQIKENIANNPAYEASQYDYEEHYRETSSNIYSEDEEIDNLFHK